MPSSSGVTAAQQRFSDAVASLCTHLTAVASNVADASACVHDVLSPAPPQGDRSNSHKDDAVVVASDGHGCVSRSGSAAVARAAVQLQHGVDGCTRTLHDCLDDLRATTSAMTSVMQSCPEEAPRLLTNLFGALTRQVGTYYRDVGVVFATCEAALAEDRRHATTTTATATTARGAKTPTTRQPHDHNDNNNNAPVPPRERSDDKPRTPTTTMTAATPPQPAHTVAAASAASSSPREPQYLCVTTTVEEALGAAVIAARPGVFAPVAVLRAHAPVADYHVRLRRAGSLGDLVARAYVSVNEDVFADVLCEVLTSDCVELGPFESPTGDVVLPRINSSSGGSSGRGMSRSKDNNDTSNNDNGDDDDDGVVVDVSALPACAWRTCSNEEHTSSLYTSYALVREECARHDDDGVNDDGTGGERVLLVHDVVHIDNDDSSNNSSTAAAGRRRVREEVLHVVTLVPSAGAVTAAALAPFARVRAYTMTTTTTAAGSTTTTSSSSAAVAAVLVSLSRTLYTRVGFAAVAESDVRDYVREQRRHGGGSSSNVGNGDDDEDAAALQQQMAAATASRRARRAGKTRAKGNNNNNNNSSSSSTAAASNNNNNSVAAAAAALSSGSSGEAVLAQLPHYRATTPRDATVTFQPNVQLASLSEPDGAANNNYSGGNDNNSSFVSSLQSLTVSGVAKGAVRGGLEVLRAPLTVGRAVSGAVLDATGVTDAMRSNMESTFRRTFPQLAGEVMVDSFGCAWQDGGALPKQGNLFITPHWLCFQSSVAAAQFAVEYDEIKDIRKAKVAKLFDTAMEVVTHVGDTYVLVNFLQRDQAYTTVMQQWLK